MKRLRHALLLLGFGLASGCGGGLDEGIPDNVEPRPATVEEQEADDAMSKATQNPLGKS
jgi:hypothetical protein